MMDHILLHNIDEKVPIYKFLADEITKKGHLCLINPAN